MKRIPTLLLSFLCAGVCAATGESLLQEISWEQLKKDGKLQVGEVVPPVSDGKSAELKVTAGKQPSQTILVIEQPKLSSDVYMLHGKVRYENVDDKGYLEMWNHFADGGAYFTRTMAPGGPMGVLSGTSAARDFELPFDATGAKSGVQKLVLNVVLPGGGTVWLSDVKLVEFKTAILKTDFKKNENVGWWRDEVGGLIGGVLGMILGFAGALIGFLAVKGRARGFVFVLVKVLIFIGVLSLITGIVALAMHQPYGVFYPLLLMGMLGIVIPLSLLPVIQKRYADAELRKMQAMDV